MKRFSVLAVVLTAVFALSASAQEVAKGIVFNDANQNGAREDGERGIGGVCVSNGREVVETARDGSYALPATHDMIVFVVKPRGWMTPVNEDNLPQFYYIHNVAGDPELKYKGVGPTGPLPESIDFPLHRHKEGPEYRTVFFGDSQVSNEQEVAYLSHDILEDLAGVDAEFGVTLGDIVNNNLSIMEPLNDAVAKVGIPWYNVIGNHDHNQDVPDDTNAMDTFKRVYGPAYYAYQYGDVHFVALDSVHWTGDGYHAELGEAQLAFVKNYLEFVPKDALLVLMMHIPVMEFTDRDTLFAMLQDRPNTFSLSAHTHDQKNLFLGPDHGWHGSEPHHHLVHVTACGSWWHGTSDEEAIPNTIMADGAPNGYSFITFDGTEYEVEFRAARRPADCQMTIYTPDFVASADAANTKVIANIFAGSPKSTVEMRFGESGEWQPMTLAPQPDPYFLKMKELEPLLPDQAGTDLPKPKDSTHIWEATLPANPAPGLHEITVRTTDIYGRTYEDRRHVRIQ